MQSKPIILIVTEWRSPIGEIEVFSESLLRHLADRFEMVIALRLHNPHELPLLAVNGVAFEHFKTPHELIQLIKRITPSLVHFQQSSELALKIATTHHFTKLPLVMSLHSVPDDSLEATSAFKAHSWEYLQKLNNLVPMVAVSPQLHAVALEHGVAMSDEVISAGVDTTKYRPGSRLDARRELGLPTDKTLILFNGQPADPKLAQLAFTLAGLPAHTNATLLTHEFPADGLLAPILSQLETRGRHLSIMPIDRYDERHHLLYQAADMYLAPSPQAGQNLAVLEAMSTGLRIINPEELATAINELETNTILHQAYGSTNRKNVVAFDTVNTTAAYAQLYEYLMQAKTLPKPRNLKH